jgi:N-acetylneuraminic acid mutarotase
LQYLFILCEVYSATVKDNLLFIFGGYSDGATYFKDLFELNLDTKRWRFIRPKQRLSLGRHSASAVLYNNKIYLFGGIATGTQKMNDILAFSLEKNEWKLITPRTPPPSGRWGHSAVVYNGAMYVMGGFGDIFSNDLWRFDFKTKVWTPVLTNGKPPRPRHFHSACIFRNKMYICGGFAANMITPDMYEFDFETSTWHCLSSNNAATNRRGHSAVVYDNAMYVFGGVSGTKNSNHLYEWCFDKNEWKIVECVGAIPSPRHFHQAIVYNGAMYVFGGISDSSNLNDVYEFRFESKKQSPERTLTSDMKTLFMAAQYTDVEFLVEGLVIPAHKCILVARSDYFAAMLRGGLKESSQNVIKISDIRAPVFKAVLEFIYTDSVTITEDIAVELLIASDRFILKKLMTICESILLRGISSENVHFLLDIASRHQANMLQKACKNFLKLQDSSGIINQPSNQPTEIS